MPSLGWGICLAVYCGLIYWFSDQSRLPTPELFDSQDKLLHAAAYGLMAWIFWQTWRPALANRSVLLSLLTVLFCALFGLSDEWHQSFVAGRDASAFDWLADAVGAILLVVLLRKRERSSGSPRVEERKSR